MLSVCEKGMCFLSLKQKRLAGLSLGQPMQDLIILRLKLACSSEQAWLGWLAWSAWMLACYILQRTHTYKLFATSQQIFGQIKHKF